MDIDLTGPLADWNARLSLVRDMAAPHPEPLAALLVEIIEQLTATTEDAPLAALRAIGVLERIAARVGLEAVGVLAEGGVSAETVATGLGTTRSKALMLLLNARDRWQHPVGIRLHRSRQATTRPGTAAASYAGIG
ncbi:MULTISPECIES: hypothetical protein [unclassified Streptomyces]|uniref:hypothetical protein n=1 Tax=unclassified Streptomyces TaxID=2593676 RepID=UPI00324BEB13